MRALVSCWGLGAGGFFSGWGSAPAPLLNESASKVCKHRSRGSTHGAAAPAVQNVPALALSCLLHKCHRACNPAQPPTHLRHARQLLRHPYGQCAAAGAKVSPGSLCQRRVGSRRFRHKINHLFGLGPGDERPGAHGQYHVAPVRRGGEVLQRRPLLQPPPPELLCGRPAGEWANNSASAQPCSAACGKLGQAPQPQGKSDRPSQRPRQAAAGLRPAPYPPSASSGARSCTTSPACPASLSRSPRSNERQVVLRACPAPITTPATASSSSQLSSVCGEAGRGGWFSESKQEQKCLRMQHDDLCGDATGLGDREKCTAAGPCPQCVEHLS